MVRVNLDTRQFRIVVWRPLAEMRNLMVLPIGTSSPEGDSDQANYEFHEQIYAWEPRGIDVWGSIRSPADTQNLRTLLLDTFNPSPASPVDRRRIGHLQPVLDALAAVLSGQAPLDWADSWDVIDAGRADSPSQRANTIAVLYNQLRWMYEVFKDVPGASVSIR